MPWYLNPRIYENLPVYQNPELYLFIFKLAATVFFALSLRKRGLRGRRLLANTYIFFYGVFLTVMLFMHNFVILGLRIFDRPASGNSPYDFHLYSLILLGTILFLQGLGCLRAALLLRAGDENGIRRARRASWKVLAVAVPLVPIQFFGIVLTIFSLLNLAAIKLFLSSPAVLNAEYTSLPEMQNLT
jgi:hypothetical protein